MMFEKRIGRDLKIVSINPETHVNVVVHGGLGNKETLGASLSPSEAKELRDALIEVYPKVEGDDAEYIVEDMGIGCPNRYEIGRYVASRRWTRMASASDIDKAKTIAKALNEAEGL
jgi:hypothetical protein